MLLSVATVFASVLLGVASAAHPPYSIWAAESAIARGQGNGLNAKNQTTASYEHGELQWGLRLLYERTGDKKYLDYIKKGVDTILAPNGTVIATDYSVVDFTLDPLRVGPSFLYLYDTFKDEKYLAATEQFRFQLKVHSRTAQGQFWHKKRYANQGWLDGIYMGEVFYATYTQKFQPHNRTAWDDIALQFKLMYENTIQATATEGQTNTQLMYHGYDYAHTQVWANADRGHSPEVWIRALGWFSMALVDVLPIFPKDHPGHQLLLDQLHTLLPRIVDAADPETGAWWLVMTWPGREGNYFESSGSVMFIYSLLRAVRLGYIQDPEGKFVAAAKKAYDYATKNWVVDNGDGTMNWLNTVIVGSLDQDGSFDYYVKQPINLNDLKGLAAFVVASYEIEELSK